VDQKLRGLAVRRAALDAEEARLLRYAEELKLWCGFGCGSLLEYMERAWATRRTPRPNAFASLVRLPICR
jgi:hypothetical protein